ncbi:hypothetical protein [Actinokineospora sp. NBRC 105648]|uniref:hypothetical protein n=1 Tax=Actinokineospora sp. NBRC 105648 TaxID=3032206 RepID=UPI0024A5B361|nr:hypothetical protein [Actinokineospora sp. NBRC 105648]GLZ38875.1 hypothetical protein Acsp05_24990 [Actinokineospora sp. NBRC 105648]
MRTDLIDPLLEPVPAAWDELAVGTGAPVFWHAAPLVVAAWTAQTPPVMAVVTDGARPVALFHGRFQGPADFRRFHRPGTVPPLGVLECRLAPASVAGHRFAADLDATARAEAVAAFERAVRQRFRVVAFCYRHVESDAVAAVRGRGRRVLSVSPDTVLTTEWSSVEDYLRSLPPKWRSQLKKIRATVAADPRVHRAVVDEVPVAQAARLVNLVRSRHQRRGLVRAPIPEQYFALLNADPATSFATYSDSRGLLALSTLHDNGDDVRMSYWGNRDRTEGGLPNLYFDHYVDVVAHTLALGRRTLYPGKGMTQIKQRFGARAEPNHLVIGR